MTGILVILLIVYAIYCYALPAFISAGKSQNVRRKDYETEQDYLTALSKVSYGAVADSLKFRNNIITLVLLVVTVVMLLVTKVSGQEVKVLITPAGVDDNELVAGWHLVMPWYEVYPMDITVWTYTFSNKKGEGNEIEADAIWSPTKEGVKMGLDISINWRIDPAFASWIYSNISEQDGDENGRYDWIENNVIRPKTISALSMVTKEYTPQEIYSYKRDEIQERFFYKLKEELEQYHLVLENVDLREVFYNPEYEKALNNRKLEEQEVLRLVEVTKQKEEKKKQAEIDAHIVVTTAKGDAEALQIKGNAISSNPKIIALKWIEKWNGDLPKFMNSGSSSLLIQPQF